MLAIGRAKSGIFPWKFDRFLSTESYGVLWELEWFAIEHRHAVPCSIVVSIMIEHEQNINIDTMIINIE